ncbi:tellurite resistance TerB family protein [Roseibium polysiphoniae]|uniref:Tellurite resistance TerB family protein n=1 Tax=Roseibium polysiphoniae TaxID=2571221 RepID=A0A944CEZ5_9HYPH|nr:tellurite resistance TerB family protein [Roseibium polysiphoniae]MBD8877708.1 tellurite resistance TerB family protein [Roseibium polysiphoniae]MBS8261628.1 tellurite resistance TerB family protein [Roseibium polysiphoniae]
MFDAKSLLDQFLGGAGGAASGGSDRRSGNGASGDLMSQGKDFLSSQGGGLALGGLAGMMLGTKTGRKIGGSAVKYGGLALVAGLAYKAYQGYQANQQGAPRPQYPDAGSVPLDAPRGTAFDPAGAQGGENAFAISLLTAMISAAKADGHIDADEQNRIFAKIDEAGLDSEAKAFLMDELRAPLDLDKVVASADTPEHAAEIYAASRLAIDPDHGAEKAYLQMLAARLDLDPALVDEIEMAVREAEAG